METGTSGARALINWRWLVPGFLLTGVMGWGVHSVLLEMCKVPYPEQLPRTGTVPFLNYAVSVWALFVFCRLAGPQVSTLRSWQKCLGLGVLLVMLNETLRVIFIVGVITTAWTYSFVDIGQGAFAPFLLGILVAVVVPRTKRWWQQALAILLVTAVMFLGVRPLVAAAFKPLLAAMAHLNHVQVYASTSWQLNTAACVGIVEPTFASFVMVALVWPRLSGRLLWRAGQFALLLALINQVFLTAFYNPFFASTLSVQMAMLSAGQFTLEWLTLGFLAALTWHLSRSDLGQNNVRSLRTGEGASSKKGR